MFLGITWRGGALAGKLWKHVVNTMPWGFLQNGNPGVNLMLSSKTVTSILSNQSFLENSESYIGTLRKGILSSGRLMVLGLDAPNYKLRHQQLLNSSIAV